MKEIESCAAKTTEKIHRNIIPNWISRGRRRRRCHFWPARSLPRANFRSNKMAADFWAEFWSSWRFSEKISSYRCILRYTWRACILYIVWYMQCMYNVYNFALSMMYVLQFRERGDWNDKMAGRFGGYGKGRFKIIFQQYLIYNSPMNIVKSFRDSYF